MRSGFHAFTAAAASSLNGRQQRMAMNARASCPRAASAASSARAWASVSSRIGERPPILA